MPFALALSDIERGTGYRTGLQAPIEGSVSSPEGSSGLLPRSRIGLARLSRRTLGEAMSRVASDAQAVTVTARRIAGGKRQH